MERQPCVYLLASNRNGTLYTGVTSNLVKRTWEHKHHAVEGFTGKYRVTTLVWYEAHETMESAIRREKAIKNWKRAWKILAIESITPGGGTYIMTCCDGHLDSGLRRNDGNSR